MKLEEYADAINCNIVMTYYHNQQSQWMAKFENVEVKENKGDKILNSYASQGFTPEEAMEDYMIFVSGKTLVFDSTNPQNRPELLVPIGLGE